MTARKNQIIFWKIFIKTRKHRVCGFYRNTKHVLEKPHENGNATTNKIAHIIETTIIIKTNIYLCTFG